MSSIGTGYDLAAATFSPDGRIFQVEYAQKAVDNSGTMIALRGNDGIVLASDKVVTSKLYVENANPRMANASDHIGCAMAGVYPDCRALLDYAVTEALSYLKEYRTTIPIRKLADQDGSQLFLLEPSGLCYEYKSWAIGKHRQAAKTEIEKMKTGEMSIRQLMKEAVRILLMVRDEGKDKNLQVELSWVGEPTQGKHMAVPNDLIRQAEEWAKAKLEEDDMDD